MLLKFSVGNCLSFKDLTTLDMSAEGLKDRKGFTHVPYLHNAKISLLKSVVIYGYNSFGKSNFIRAYALFREAILNSFSLGKANYEIDIEPFRLNTSMLSRPVFFEAVFIIKQTKYRFGFEVSNKKIVSEWLYYADGTVRENILYFRAGQEYRDISKLWLKNAGNRVEHAKAFTKSNNLFVSALLSQEGVPRIEDIASWFKGNVVLYGNYSFHPSQGAIQIYADEGYRSMILKFLESADLGFISVFEKLSKIIANTGYRADLINDLHETEKAAFELYTQHKVYNEQYAFQKMIEFQLTKNESSGSIKYFILACFLAYAIKNSQLVLIDELDASLHTQLLLFLLETFNDEKNNTSGSQIIFTTHNTVILDRKLRRDQIWFVDKNQYGESTLHRGHTPETPIRVDKSLEEEYRSGKLKKGTSRTAINNNIPSLFDDGISKE